MNYIKNVGDNQNKFGDTATVFQLGLMKDDEVYNFGDNQVTVNIANETGYVLSVTPDKSSQNTVLDLDFNKVPLKNLTPDNYQLEVEVQSTDGDIAKFPTSGAMTFSINHDLKETSGTLVPTVTFDNVLDAVDEKIAVYMDTVKVGPAGPQGPAGNVDTSHDNTFTGKNSFTQQITGAFSSRGATFTDFAQVAAAMNTYAGQWRTSTTAIVNSPVDGLTYYAIEVVPDTTGTAGIIRVAVYGSQDYYYNIVNSGALTGWKKISRDDKVVHNTGNETVAGDKALTGKITFSQQINGALATRAATFTDFAVVSTKMFDYAGTWYVNGTNILNKPSDVGNYLVVKVTPANIQGSGKIEVFEFSSGKTYTNNVSLNTLGQWVKVANDSTVVHNAGMETVAGDKTFTGSTTFSNNTTIKSGNYGLRVTTTGIQKTSDGGTTWVNI